MNSKTSPVEMAPLWNSMKKVTPKKTSFTDEQWAKLKEYLAPYGKAIKWADLKDAMDIRFNDYINAKKKGAKKGRTVSWELRRRWFDLELSKYVPVGRLLRESARLAGRTKSVKVDVISLRNSDYDNPVKKMSMAELNNLVQELRTGRERPTRADARRAANVLEFLAFKAKLK